MPTETDEFVARLRAAFPAEVLDFKDALTGGTDGGEFRDAVAGKTWTELDQALIGRRSDVLSFLQPEYFVAVLPAFLRSLVEEGTSTGAPRHTDGSARSRAGASLRQDLAAYDRPTTRCGSGGVGEVRGGYDRSAGECSTQRDQWLEDEVMMKRKLMWIVATTIIAVPLAVAFADML